MCKHRRTINIRKFLKMFPDKYSYLYNVYKVEKHKHRARVLYGRFRPVDSELYVGIEIKNSGEEK